MEQRRKLHCKLSEELGSSIFLFWLSVSNSLPTASTISLEEKETQHTYFPLLIAEFKARVIKPYMNLTT